MTDQQSEVTIRRTPDRAGDLVGAVEASEILGVERTRIARYVKTGVMPEPVAKLRATSVWLRADVEDLKAERAAKKSGTAASRSRARREMREAAEAVKKGPEAMAEFAGRDNDRRAKEAAERIRSAEIEIIDPNEFRSRFQPE